MNKMFSNFKPWVRRGILIGLIIGIIGLLVLVLFSSYISRQGREIIISMVIGSFVCPFMLAYFNKWLTYDVQKEIEILKQRMKRFDKFQKETEEFKREIKGSDEFQKEAEEGGQSE